MLLTYNEFTTHVMNNRKINNQEISMIAEGRIWTGKQSLDKKLADQIGGIIDTIDYASITSKLDNYTIDSYPKPVNYFNKFFNLFNVQYNVELFDKKNLKNLIQLSIFYKENGNKPAYLLPFIDIP
jgi:ClpP class serine protease